MFNELISILLDKATILLMSNSCIESFFLVPPPDIALIAICLKNPQYSLFYALLCTLASTIGGVIGYFIGKYGGLPILNKLLGNKQEQFNKIQKMYEKYGVAAVLFAAFTPIPYKVFTIASGILKMNIVSFCMASFIGRGMRFFIVSLLILFYGEEMKKYSEWVILFITLILVVFFGIFYIVKNRKEKK